MMREPLDVHCETDDGLTLCGHNAIPRVPYDTFVHMGEALASAPPPRRYPWQRCPSCVAVISATPIEETSP